MPTIGDAKRLVALSPEGARLLGAGVYRPCHQGRYNAAAEAALSDETVGYTPEERRLIAEFIEAEEEGPREFMLRVRLSDSERGMLERLATTAGLSMSEYVRQTALAGCEDEETVDTQPTYQFWCHQRSGERYAIRIEGGHVTGACGPLHYNEVEEELLPDYHYDDEPDLAEDIDANQDDYGLVEFS